MEKIIGVTDFQRRFRSVLDEVIREHSAYVLARGSHPEAVLLSYEDFLRLRKLEEEIVEQHFRRLMDRLAVQNAAYSDDEVAADVAAAQGEVESHRTDTQPASAR